MLKIKKIGQSAREIASDTQGMLVRRKGDNEQPFAKGMMLPSDTADNFEEVDPAELAKTSYTKAEYRAEVEKLIAERYTTGQEIQFAREKETAEGYAEYLAYIEQCKARAKARLEAPATGE